MVVTAVDMEAMEALAAELVAVMAAAMADMVVTMEAMEVIVYLKISGSENPTYAN